MKVLCPICQIEGSAQIRGKSVRVGHYKGYHGQTRIIEWHATNLDAIKMVNNDKMVNKNMVNKNLNLASNSQNKLGGRSLAWSGHRLPKPATRVQIPVAAPCRRFV